MDETTKVLIGTISGFIIAFFAEPVKNYFQYRTKLYNLRLALYKELLHNYLFMSGEIEAIKKDDLRLSASLFKNTIRTECYEYALEHEITTLFALEDSLGINTLYGLLNYINGLLSDNKIYDKDDDCLIPYLETFKENYEGAFRTTFKKSTLKKIMPRKRYKELLYKDVKDKIIDILEDVKKE